MKKIFKILIFAIAFFIATTTTFAKTSYVKLGEAIPNTWLHIKTANIEKNKYIYKIINTSNNDLLYCIEPGVLLKEGYFTEYTELSQVDLNLSEEDWKYINYIAFYGYNYKDRTDIKWYVATQFMIWDYLLKDEGEIYFLDEFNNKIDLYKEEIAAIQKDIDNMNILPSFAKNDYEPNNPQYIIKLNEEITIEDTNNILQNFDVTANNVNVKPIVKDNKITVSFSHPGDVLIFYTKEYKNNVGIPKIFYSATSQSVISRGNINMPSGLTQFKVLNPSLTLIKESCEKTNFSLEGGTYGIYYENGYLYDTIKTDNSGKAYLEEIWSGKYYLQEINAPYGYELNEEKVYFEVIDKDIIIEVKNNVIKKQLTIEKYTIDHLNNLDIEENATFKIYDSNNKLVNTIKTNEYGKTNTMLPYGTYKIVQSKGSKGYLYTNDILVTIDENFNELNSLIIKNKQITGNIKITKIDYDTKEVIKGNASFKILNTSTNKYLTIDNSTIFNTTNGILEINNIPYGKYIIEEVEAPTGYVINKKTKTFTIKNDSETLDIEIANKKIKNDIKIIKKDINTKEVIKEEAKFKILNIDTNKYLTINNNEEFKTNKGLLEIKDLEYGKYQLIEVEAPINYNISNEKIIFEVKEDNQKIELEVFNKKKESNLTIKKVAKINKIPLNNVLIGIYDTNKNLINKSYTNSFGLIGLNNLEVGTYYIKELETIENYKLNTKEYEIEIKADIDNFIEIENEEITGSISLVKIDALTYEPLKGVKLAIYNNNMELINEFETNEEGKYDLTNIPIGKYYIKELLALNNYELNDEKIEVEVKENTKSTITLTNRTKIDIPKTDTNEFLIAFFISGLVLLVGVYICNYDNEN